MIRHIVSTALIFHVTRLFISFSRILLILFPDTYLILPHEDRGVQLGSSTLRARRTAPVVWSRVHSTYRGASKGGSKGAPAGHNFSELRTAGARPTAYAMPRAGGSPN